ncbi:MAG: ABC transporter ATP-binding protein [Actinomycetota bacterium]
MAGIVLEGVTKRFPDGTVAVRELDLAIGDGEFMVLVGPSGCGKTTALRLVAGLEELTSGTISIADRVVNQLPPRDRDVAMVFQSYALYPHMSVFDNMAFGLKLRKVARAEIRRRVEEAAGMLGLKEVLHRKPRQLSGGQRQRVAMGRAIVREPAAFLMDEPLSNLDSKLRVQMRAEIARLHQRLKTTTIYVTHDQTEAITMADRVAVLRQGVLQQVGVPQELYEHPVNLFVAGFIGSPAMNLVSARLETGGGEIFAHFGSQRLILGRRIIEKHRRLGSFAGREVILGVRPEDIEDGAFAPDGEPDRTLDVTISLAEPLGAEVVAHFEVDAPPVHTKDTLDLAADLDRGADPGQYEHFVVGGEHATFTARLNPRSRAAAGGSMKVTVDVERLYFFDPETGAAIT